jgi:hypothetical protein
VRARPSSSSGFSISFRINLSQLPTTDSKRSSSLGGRTAV